MTSHNDVDEQFSNFSPLIPWYYNSENEVSVDENIKEDMERGKRQIRIILRIHFLIFVELE
eukprot:5848461-Ditylum_brightwellii.AAC.1